MTSPTPEIDRGEKKLIEKDRLKDSHLLRERGKDSHWARYLTAVQLGMTKGDSAAYAGIGESTVRLWQNNAEEDEIEGLDTVFVEFFQAVRSTRARMLSRALGTIEKARQEGEWKAATWLLERHGYNKTTEVDATVSAQLTYVLDNQDLGA